MSNHVIGAACLAAILLTLAPGAAADEWIDLFDGETLYGWQPLGDVEWAVDEGAIVGQRGTGGWLATTSAFMDFELKAKIKLRTGSSAGLVLRAGLDGHWTENGAGILLLSAPKGAVPGWREVVVTADGGAVTATINGEPAEVLGGGSLCGHIGIHCHGKSKVEVTGVTLRPLNVQPIFNGENLDGWNIIPDRASKFSVVDGAINIKDGNGQIETAGVYKDFLLQIDIISNGEHLNSGVFFRGPVGIFWKGYESQVRNQWLKAGRHKPVDFGTGGIYGNQPARQVVSNDHEWFTKTIVCRGNHMAVWINGYQVTDYLELRAVPDNQSGKDGYVPGPGTIHLQGHDPTTDLSFKNIVLQEYPSE